MAGKTVPRPHNEINRTIAQFNIDKLPGKITLHKRLVQRVLTWSTGWSGNQEGWGPFPTDTQTRVLQKAEAKVEKP